MKIVPKALYGRPLVALSDNTRVTKPVPVLRMEYKPKPGEFLFTDRRTGKKTLVKPKNEVVSMDKRNIYLRQQDQKRALQVYELYERDKKQEEGMRNLQGFLTFVSPSTYVGPVFNNNGKSYVENVMSGEGTGSTAGNIAIDMLTPVAIGGITKGILTGNRLYRIRLFSKAIDNSSPKFDLNKLLKRKAYASINSNETDNIPIGLRAARAIRAVKKDINEMNLYHIQNVLEYNISTGNDLSPVLFGSLPGDQIKIMPTNLEFDDFVRLLNTNSPVSNIENTGGIFRPSDNTVYLRPNSSYSNIHHELLHLNRYGITNPEVTKWRIALLVDPDKTKNLSLAALNYYLSEVEAPVHLRLLGIDYGIKVGDPYPGDKAFDLLTSNRIGGSSYYMKRNTPEEKRLLWRAFNGTLFGTSIPVIIGTNTLR